MVRESRVVALRKGVSETAAHFSFPRLKKMLHETMSPFTKAAAHRTAITNENETARHCCHHKRSTGCRRPTVSRIKAEHGLVGL